MPKRGGAQVEAHVGGLGPGHLAAGGEDAAGEGVVGRLVDRLDAEQLVAGIAESGVLALLGIATQHDVLEAGGEPGDLQAQWPCSLQNHGSAT